MRVIGKRRQPVVKFTVSSSKQIITHFHIPVPAASSTDNKNEKSCSSITVSLPKAKRRFFIPTISTVGKLIRSETVLFIKFQVAI